MNRIKSHRIFIEVLTEADETLFKAIIKSVSDERIDFISEICKNILAGVILLKPADKASLAPHADIIRSVASKKFKTRTRRQLMVRYFTLIKGLLKSSFRRVFKPDK